MNEWTNERTNKFKWQQNNSYNTLLWTYLKGRYLSDWLWYNLTFIHLLIKLLEKTQFIKFDGTDYRATQLYSSGEQNAAFSYIMLRLTYIRGLILIGPGSSDWCY